jgi:UDP-N-acetylglucosamine 2-epimerase (non-hydrolysing)
MKRILIIFGTRPEAIKLCPLVHQLYRYKNKFKTSVCITAQHRQMLDQVLDIFHLIPDHDLNLMTNNQTLFDITSRILIETGKIIESEKPDILIVQGDTTTTFASALAAFYHKVPVGHVEAGLRTYNKYAPFPEEINRKLTSAITDIHFTPTTLTERNLIAEGIQQDRIRVTGNTVIDALLMVKDQLLKENNTFQELAQIDFTKKIILVTGHRRENFGSEFENICHALKTIAGRHKEIEIVYPVHLNPNVRRPVFSILKDIENIKLIEPLDYKPFLSLMNRSNFIITDSGGIQEEAPSLGKPVLVMRNTTERPEAVEAGAVKIVGTNIESIISASEILIQNKTEYKKMAKEKNPYGDGKACQRIIDWLINHL